MIPFTIFLISAVLIAVSHFNSEKRIRDYENSEEGKRDYREIRDVGEGRF